MSEPIIRNLVYARDVLQRAHALLAHTLDDSDRYYPDETTFRAAVTIKTDIIATAPALLEALRALTAVYDRVGGPLAVDPAIKQARAAIRLAEGGE